MLQGRAWSIVDYTVQQRYSTADRNGALVAAALIPRAQTTVVAGVSTRRTLG